MMIIIDIIINGGSRNYNKYSLILNIKLVIEPKNYH